MAERTAQQIEGTLVESVKRNMLKHFEDYQEARRAFERRFAQSPLDAIERSAEDMVLAQVAMGLAEQVMEYIESACSADPGTVARFYGETPQPESEIAQVRYALQHAQDHFTRKLLQEGFRPDGGNPAQSLVERMRAKATADFITGFTGVAGNLALVDGYLSHKAKQEAEPVA